MFSPSQCRGNEITTQTFSHFYLYLGYFGAKVSLNNCTVNLELEGAWKDYSKKKDLEALHDTILKVYHYKVRFSPAYNNDDDPEVSEEEYDGTASIYRV